MKNDDAAKIEIQEWNPDECSNKNQIMTKGRNNKCGSGRNQILGVC